MVSTHSYDDIVCQNEETTYAILGKCGAEGVLEGMKEEGADEWERL